MTSPPESGVPAPDWSSLVDHWKELSDTWFQQLSDRVNDNAPKFDNGAYGRDEWFGDVAWFFNTLAENTAATAQMCNDVFPPQ
jgi:hypothetical protein